MDRVATIALQRTMADAIQRTQSQLAVTQKELATGRKAQDYADLGTQTARNISARSMVARTESQATLSKHVATTLAIYDAHITGIEDAVGGLREQLLTAVGSENSADLTSAIQAAFEQYRTGLNAVEAGVSLFAGSRGDVPPFAPASLDEVLATPVDQAFRNDTVRASAHVADGLNISYGLLADEMGGKIYEAFQTLAGAGAIGDRLTDTQKQAVLDAVGQIEAGLRDMRLVNADNGRRQGQVESLAARAEERKVLLQEVVAANEDADLGEVALRLAQQKASLEASYSVFAQLSSLNLTRFLN